MPASVPSSGVSIVVVPICEPAGQAPGAELPTPNSASVQADIPSADWGESTVPTGSTTSARFTVELFAGTPSVTVYALGVSARVVSSATAIVGWNGTPPAQPVGVKVDCLEPLAPP